MTDKKAFIYLFVLPALILTGFITPLFFLEQRNKELREQDIQCTKSCTPYLGTVNHIVNKCVCDKTKEVK